jgi:lauroyl/myristoyl acyltransferase
MQRTLFALGILLLIMALLWPWLAKLGLGHLPGDIVIKKGNVRIYIPLMTCFLISILLSFILWLIHK